MQLAGDLEDRAPYHWDGDLADFGALMDSVFVATLLGTEPSAGRPKRCWTG